MEVHEQLALRAVSVFLVCLAALRLITALPGNSHGISRWRFGPWYLLWASFAFGLASLTWLGTQQGSAQRIALPSVVDGLGIFGISVAVWTVGYLIGPPGVVRKVVSSGLGLLLRGTSTTVRSGSLPWVLYAIGTVARLSGVALTGRFGYVGDPSGLVTSAVLYGQLLHIVSSFTLFAIVAAAYRAFTTSVRGSKLTLWFLVAAEVVIGALSGGKESFVLSALAVLIPYGVVRGRLSLRVMLIGALLFLWLVVPFNAAYRGVVRGESSTLAPSAALATAPEVLSGSVRSQPPQETIADSSMKTMYRIREIDSIAIITQRTPGTIGYRSPGELVIAPVLGLVPRVVWPDKPIFASGYEFSQEYYEVPSTTYTSTAITPLGDLYRHGGWLIVVVGMLAVGAVCRMSDTLLRPEIDPRALCFVIVFLPIIVKSEMDILGMLTSIPSGIVAATIGARLIFRGQRADDGKTS